MYTPEKADKHSSNAPVRQLAAGKAAVQLQDNRPKTVVQQKAAESIVQKKANNTGLPDNLKSGIENLSGYSMDDVKVHYNSAKPAQLQALAYAQGTDIHVAQGQEKHLPHEAWHVVQQKQGRVRPTLQMKGNVNVNDDKGLEKEADVMSGMALKNKNSIANTRSTRTKSLPNICTDDTIQQVANLFQLHLDNSFTATNGSLIEDHANSSFHKLAFQLMKNDKDGAWNFDFGIKEKNQPIQAQLKIGRNWIKVANTIYEKVLENGGDDSIAEILVKWSKDRKKTGRDFESWATAIQAARQAEGQGLRNQGASSGKKILFTLLIIFLLILTLGSGAFLLGANSRYEVRSDMSSSASIARRPLEPLMAPIEIGRMQNLAQTSQVKDIQKIASQVPLQEILENNADIEKLFPDINQLVAFQGDLEQISPQLKALEPVLEKVKSLLEELRPNELENPSNVGLYHEHVFLNPIPNQSPVRDSSPFKQQNKQSPPRLTDIGAMDDGIRPDKQELMHTYEKPVAHYDRDKMKTAALEVAKDFGKYKGITHNCQDYVDAVVTVYKKSGGKEIVPTQRTKITLFFTDMLIEYIGFALDSGVNKAVISELSGLKTPNPPSECAITVSNRLGISSDIIGGTIDTVLHQSIDLGQTGIKVPLDKILCDKNGLEMTVNYVNAQLDKQIAIHEEGKTTLREVLCTPKGKQDRNVLFGVLFELARVKGGPQILAGVPNFIKSDELAKNKLMTSLTERLAKNLFDKLNMAGLCK